jgi:hypothetical protein
MKRRAAVVLFAVVAAISLFLAPAYATGRHHRGHGRVLVVDNEHRHRSCLGTRNPFDTIQGAVDVARPGATIWVCPGLYEETVKVETPHLTLKGANAGRDATRSGRHRESIVSHLDPHGTVQLLADDITWDGFTIRGFANQENGPGMATSERHSGYLIRDTIFVDNGVGLDLGASGQGPSFVCRNRFVANNEFTAGGGFGIFSERGARQVLITYNRFPGHIGAGVFFADRGHPQRVILIDHNKSVDDLSFATLYNTSRVRVTHNSATARVGDTDFPGPASAIFIGARNDRVLVHRNRVHAASGNGIDVTPSAEPHQGKPNAAPTSITVSKNTAEHAKLAGLHMATGTAHVAVTANTALDNTKWDCQDESAGTGTAGTANTWTDNLGGTSSPAGLCSPPPTTDQPGHHHKKHKKKHHKQDPCTCQKHPKAF